MPYNVKRVVKQNVHTCVRNAHTRYTAWNEKEYESECEEERKLHNESTVNESYTPVH